MEENSQLLEMTADIVSAYVGNNNVQASEVPGLISSIHAALSQVSTGTVEPEPEPREPAVPIRKSITPDYLICLEDGRKFKSLKRHLRTKYNMTPDDYRSKWGLPKDYPMVAPNYAKARSDMARSMRLGQGGRGRGAHTAEADGASSTAATKKRGPGRPRKNADAPAAPKAARAGAARPKATTAAGGKRGPGRPRKQAP